MSDATLGTYQVLGPAHRCGRRGPYDPSTPFRDDHSPEPDMWHPDGTCSYCGSLSADEFMKRLEAGDIEVEPTDKSYKVYLRNAGGAPLTQSYRNCPDLGRECREGPEQCTHWVTQDASQGKFYFQHLTEEQQRRFVELLNVGRIKIGIPGYFYVLPYFCVVAWKK